MLLDLGFMPHRSSHTNVFHDIIKTGICLADICDHLPIFCTVANKPPTLNGTKHFRDDSFLKDVADIDFKDLVADDVNRSINNLVAILRQISDKHAPLRRLNKNV